MYCTPKAGNLFYHNSYQMQYNENETKTAGADGKVGDYSRLLEDCTISEQTRKFLECIVMLSDLFERTSEALVFAYGEHEEERLISERYYPKSEELSSVLYGFLCNSISENLGRGVIYEI